MAVNAVPGRDQLRRRIYMRQLSDLCATGWLEDDFHHYGVRIQHDGRTVLEVTVHAERFPWATCADVGGPLQELVGKPLIERASDIGKLIDMRKQCTHVFDLTGVLLAFITSGQNSCRYEALIQDRERFSAETELLAPTFGEGEAKLFRNDELVKTWHLNNDCVTTAHAPPHLTLGNGFREWTESLPLIQAEYAFILRRAVMVAGGRTVDHDNYRTAAEMHVPALCHSYQPENRELAFRCEGQTRNYSNSADGMLSRIALWQK